MAPPLGRRPAAAMLCAAAITATACTSVESADLAALLAQEAFPVTQGSVPADADTVALVAGEDSGFYLFGLAPVVPLSMPACVRELVAAARRHDAHGIADVRIDYRPPGLSLVFLQGWTGCIRLTGSAWRRRR